MAHGKTPGTISKILAPSPPPCPSPGKQSQEEQQGLVKEVSEHPPCTLNDNNNDQLSPPVSANHYYMSCDPSPEDMEDTCSEYDNVGSDVEQDYDEVLHLNRESVADMRYYKPYCPEDGAYTKHLVGENIKENSSAVDQFSSGPRHSAEIYKGSQSDSKPHKTGHRFRSHCAQIARDEADREVEKGQENRFFFSDGDDIEEVLDGAKFIEEMESTENSVQRPTSLYQSNENERITKGSDEREREDDTRVTRNHNIQGASRKFETKEKERQVKGRGRRMTGEDTELVISGVKGSTTNNAEQRPKTLSKDCKKAAVRTKARSGSSKQHPPPPPRHPHAQSPADTQKSPPRRETPSAPRPSPSSANSQNSEHRVIKPSQGALEQQTESLEEKQPEKPKQSLSMRIIVYTGQQETFQMTLANIKADIFLQQSEKPSAAVIPEDVPEELRGPQCPDLVSVEKTNTPKVLSDKNPSKSVRMSQAHEAVSQIKSQDEDSQMMTEVDLFISTKAVKVLNADTQETMMDSALRTISYIADIGSIVVLMARRRMSQASSEDFTESPDSASEGKSQYRMICYVFESEDAQLIAQSIGQAFSVAYREFLRANGINPTDLSQKQYSDIINSQEMYHDDLVHFSNSDNCKELYVEKLKGESLGVVIVESGWGSILPTVILASMLNSGPAARTGKLSVGDQIMSINDTSLGLKNQVKVKLSIVSCPPVTTVLIKRPDLKFQLGFSVQNGIICSLMRGGIAERGGVRVGHRIIEINGQSVVAMAHEKIVQTLSVSVGEINMKTMPAVMFRLLTGQETPIYI
ncbi:Amyloid-beta A4 precursor protein-binding family A member 2 [Channa argus]|uniref:Amyloid-beta A4 protein-binding family A member 2 n=1 Tax=Channa argus TaxID=215402 RepID=A0A6G1PFC1_CHAAH|nr:Amyloid-beta A4 precursor protein-binding family A member 2 [Channa argus]